MKSKTKIDEQLGRKRNPELAETILKAKKNEKWLRIAGILSSPRRKKVVANLSMIDKESKEGDTIVVPGKVLGSGEVSKRIKIVAFSFSEEAVKKLKEKKCEIELISKEMDKNPEAKGVKVIT